MIPSEVSTPTLHHGECLAFMRSLPAGSIDLLIADGPYYKVKGDAWDRQWKTAADFLTWMGTIADEFKRVLAPNGSLYSFASPQLAARVECVIADRFEVLNSIAWAKPPYSTKAEMFDKATMRGYFPASERIVFAEQQGAEGVYASPCEALRAQVMEPLRSYIIGEIQRARLTRKDINRAVGSCLSGGGMASHYVGDTHQWELPTAEHYESIKRAANCNGAEHLRREYEDLRAEYETLRAEYDERRTEYETLRRPFTVSADVPYTDVWTFPTVQAYAGKHPCEKPAAMLDHMITASSRPGAVVLDPFMGSGATGERAALLGRRFIGCEIGDYFAGAEKRVRDAAERQIAFARPKRGVSKTIAG